VQPAVVYTPAVPELRGLRWEDCKFEASPKLFFLRKKEKERKKENGEKIVHVKGI
jgi:hypothetical protein